MIVNEGSETVRIAEGALAGGVRIVQYRAKGGINAETLHALRRATRSAGALLILNDDWRAAKRYDCDGAHLGPGDDGFDRPDFVRVSWPDGVIGISCATDSETNAAASAGADYAGVGSVYATTSKGDAGEPIGIERLREIVRATDLPVAAIGGITVDRIGEIGRSGAAMAAVISAVASAEEPASAAQRLVRAWDEAER